MELSERQLLLLDEFMYSDIAPSSQNMTLQMATERFTDSSGNISTELIQQAIDNKTLNLSGDLVGKPEDVAHVLNEIRSDPQLSTLRIDSTTPEYTGSIRGACFVDKSGDATVAFRGTGGSYQQWSNNFEGYGDVSQQSERDAAAFINSLPYNNITVTGHSNGGNQAMYATVVCGDKIDRCVSYEGQGGSKEFMQEYAGEIAQNQSKITNICGSRDFVNPVLISFAGTTRYVESDSSILFGMLDHGGYGILTAGDRNGSFDSNGNFKESAFIEQSFVGKAVDVVTNVLAEMSDIPVVGPALELFADLAGGVIGMAISGNLKLDVFDPASWKAHLDHFTDVIKSIADYKDRVTGDVLNLLNQGVKTICGFGETVYDKFTSFIGSIFGGGGKKTASGGDGRSFGGGSRSFGGGGANTIKVSTEEMAVTIAKYQSEKGRLMEALSVCNNAAQMLARSWAGPSFMAMSVQMANTYKNLYQSINRVDDAIAELKATIGIMENTEKKVKASAASLDIGTSPFS